MQINTWLNFHFFTFLLKLLSFHTNFILPRYDWWMVVAKENSPSFGYNFLTCKNMKWTEKKLLKIRKPEMFSHSSFYHLLLKFIKICSAEAKKISWNCLVMIFKDQAQHQSVWDKLTKRQLLSLNHWKKKLTLARFRFVLFPLPLTFLWLHNFGFLHLEWKYADKRVCRKSQRSPRQEAEMPSEILLIIPPLIHI